MAIKQCFNLSLIRTPMGLWVVDLFGKADGGTFVGDKLAYYIWKTTGAEIARHYRAQAGKV